MISLGRDTQKAFSITQKNSNGRFTLNYFLQRSSLIICEPVNEIHSSESKNKKDIIRQIKTFVKSNTDKAALTEARDSQDKNLWKVGWASYSFKVEFNGNKFKSIDISGMLDN